MLTSLILGTQLEPDFQDKQPFSNREMEWEKDKPDRKPCLLLVAHLQHLTQQAATAELSWWLQSGQPPGRAGGQPGHKQPVASVKRELSLISKTKEKTNPQPCTIHPSIHPSFIHPSINHPSPLKRLFHVHVSTLVMYEYLTLISIIATGKGGGAAAPPGGGSLG